MYEETTCALFLLHFFVLPDNIMEGHSLCLCPIADWFSFCPTLKDKWMVCFANKDIAQNRYKQLDKHIVRLHQEY